MTICFRFLTGIFISVVVAHGLYGQYDSIPYDDYQRTYLVHFPVDVSSDATLPLVIAMHGGFGSALNLQEQSGLSKKSDQEKFIVVYPEGVRDGLLNIRTWNAGWCCGFASTAEVDDVGFINALLDTLLEKYPIDPTRIYATGMSNGGFMSYRLACELSGRIAAIAPVACSMSIIDCKPTRPTPIIHFHSYQDENVPFTGGVGQGVSNHYNMPLDSVAMIFSQLYRCDMQADTITSDTEIAHIKWDGCECNVEIHQYFSHDGGHSWPGGKQTIIGDPVSQHLSANDLMWEFFEQYSLDCATTLATRPKDDFFPHHLYPNPTRDVLHIEMKSGQIAEVTIYNTSGMRLKQYVGSKSIDVHDLPSGIYFIRIGSHGQYWFEKFVKN